MAKVGGTNRVTQMSGDNHDIMSSETNDTQKVRTVMPFLGNSKRRQTSSLVPEVSHGVLEGEC